MILISVFMVAIQVAVMGVLTKFDFIPVLLWVFNFLLWSYCMSLEIDIEFIEGDLIALEKLLGEK